MHGATAIQEDKKNCLGLFGLEWRRLGEAAAEFGKTMKALDECKTSLYNTRAIKKPYKRKSVHWDDTGTCGVPSEQLWVVAGNVGKQVARLASLNCISSSA